MLSPMNFKITVTKEIKRKGGKERVRRKKGGEEKKAMAALLVFIMATLEIVFGRKQTGVNFFKTSARNI